MQEREEKKIMIFCFLFDEKTFAKFERGKGSNLRGARAHGREKSKGTQFEREKGFGREKWRKVTA